MNTQINVQYIILFYSITIFISLLSYLLLKRIHYLLTHLGFLCLAL